MGYKVETAVAEVIEGLIGLRQGIGMHLGFPCTTDVHIGRKIMLRRFLPERDGQRWMNLRRTNFIIDKTNPSVFFTQEVKDDQL